MKASAPPSACWVISDGAAGNERQALALADALGLPSRIWRLRLRRPWSWLAPRLALGARLALPPELRAALHTPWPALAIGCGRQAALLTRWLRQRSGGNTFCVQILDPRIAPEHFDLVIAPRHDGLHGANVLQTLGSLNPVDDDWLAAAAANFRQLGALPAPRTAVLIGASHRAQRLDRAYFEALLARLSQLPGQAHGSFLVSTSRRTPPELARWLRRRFAAFPGLFWGGMDDGPNPYAGLLAHATRIVVTPDSVNMLSEACASGKPVLTFAPQALHGKLASFHAALREAAHLHDLAASMPIAASTRPLLPLRETAQIAAAVLAAWRARHAPAIAEN